MERLQKYLAAAGIASRRRAEEIILQGKVQVNGVTVTELGTKVDPQSDRVTVDNQEVRAQKEFLYLLLNKPEGVVTTLSDPQRRAKVSDLLKGIKTRVFPVGRLDYATCGALILTNDGELACRLTHPRHKVDKTYLARVAGYVRNEDIQRLKSGIPLEDGLTAPAKVRKLSGIKGTPLNKETTLLEIIIHEGRNRQVRRMCDAIGHHVLELKRTAVGPVKLGDLQPGSWRTLQTDEVAALKKACKMI